MRSDGVLNFPRKAKKSAARLQLSVAVIVACGNQYCLLQRPATGLLANLLEFPSLDVTTDTGDKGRFIH